MMAISIGLGFRLQSAVLDRFTEIFERRFIRRGSRPAGMRCSGIDAGILILG
jgi:hypothetical protein